MIARSILVCLSALVLGSCDDQDPCSLFPKNPPGSDFPFFNLPDASAQGAVADARELAERCYNDAPFEGSKYPIIFEVAKEGDSGKIVLIYEVYGIDDRRIAYIFSNEGKPLSVFRFSAIQN